MKHKYMKAITIALFGLIAFVCLIFLFMPTVIEIDIPQGSYTLTLDVGLQHYVLPVNYADGPVNLNASGFNIVSIAKYPGYYIGLIIALVLSCIGIFIASVGKPESGDREGRLE